MRQGTLAICLHNLDQSGANQVIWNIIQARLHKSNLVVIYPKEGPFAEKLKECNVSVKIGELSTILSEIKDCFCILANTIMTADLVVQYSACPIPIVWIIHEWWDEQMIVDNLKLRNIETLNLDTVKEAFVKASKVVFVCEAQKNFYLNEQNFSTGKDNACVIYVGVPPPQSPCPSILSIDKNIQLTRPFVFLCLG